MFVCVYGKGQSRQIRNGVQGCFRGLCEDSLFDKFLYPDNREGRLVWMGITGTYIAYNAAEHLWIAAVSKVPTYIV